MVTYYSLVLISISISGNKWDKNSRRIQNNVMVVRTSYVIQVLRYPYLLLRTISGHASIAEMWCTKLGKSDLACFMHLSTNCLDMLFPILFSMYIVNLSITLRSSGFCSLKIRVRQEWITRWLLPCYKDYRTLVVSA